MSGDSRRLLVKCQKSGSESFVDAVDVILDLFTKFELYDRCRRAYFQRCTYFQPNEEAMAPLLYYVQKDGNIFKVPIAVGESHKSIGPALQRSMVLLASTLLAVSEKIDITRSEGDQILYHGLHHFKPCLVALACQAPLDLNDFFCTRYIMDSGGNLVYPFVWLIDLGMGLVKRNLHNVLPDLLEMCSTLIAKGADVHEYPRPEQTHESFHYSPLNIAREREVPELVDLLIEHGADPERESENIRFEQLHKDLFRGKGRGNRRRKGKKALKSTPRLHVL